MRSVPMHESLLPDAVTLYLQRSDGKWFGSILRRVQLIRNLTGISSGAPVAAGEAMLIPGSLETSKPYLAYALWAKLDASVQADYWTLPPDGSGLIYPGEGDVTLSDPRSQPGVRPLLTCELRFRGSGMEYFLLTF